FWIDKESAENLNYKVAAQYDKFKAKNIRMNLSSDESRSANVIISARNLSLGYDVPLFKDIDIDLREGEALELRGRNGAGKSTIIKKLLGDTQPVLYEGELTLNTQTRVGVYEQEVSHK